jgi:CO/xanthine dehydrogenase FAD-binding subunit
MALGAQLRLTRAGGSRQVDLDGFITGPGVCGVKKNELLTEISIPSPGGGGAGSAYLKITRRQAMEVTIVGCAASVTLDEAKSRVIRARLVFTSVAPVLLRVPEAEQVLVGEVPSLNLVDEAVARARSAAHPIDDHRAPAFYRSEMVELTARRALVMALERAGRRVAA